MRARSTQIERFRTPFLSRGRAPLDRQSGFTLLELLVVLAILGLLIGLVAPRTMGLLGSSKHKIAEQTIARLDGILDIYKLDVGNYPTTEQGLEALVRQPSGVIRWNGPYIKGDEVPLDPWGKPYQYRAPSKRPNRAYDLFTFDPEIGGGSGDAAAIYN